MFHGDKIIYIYEIINHNIFNMDTNSLKSTTIISYLSNYSWNNFIFQIIQKCIVKYIHEITIIN